MDFKLLITTAGSAPGDLASVIAEFETSFLADSAAAKINATKREDTLLTYTVVKLY